MSETTQSTTTTAADAASNAVSDARSRIREILSRFRLPGLDLEAFILAREADIDAIAKATSVALAGAETITNKQAELLKATLEEINSAVKARKTPDSIEAGSEAIGKQTDLLRSALTRTLDGLKEVAETVQKSQTEIYEITLDRARSNAEQLRTLFVKSDDHKDKE